MTRVNRSAASIPGVTDLPGFPTWDEVLERYAARTGLDLGRLPWYLAFAHFKFAVITQGIAARVRDGAMAGQDFGDLRDEVRVIAADGLAMMDWTTRPTPHTERHTDVDFEISPPPATTATGCGLYERARLLAVEAEYDAYRAEHGAHVHPPVMEELMAEARKRDLWNLFLRSPACPTSTTPRSPRSPAGRR